MKCLLQLFKMICTNEKFVQNGFPGFNNSSWFIRISWNFSKLGHWVPHVCTPCKEWVEKEMDEPEIISFFFGFSVCKGYILISYKGCVQVILSSHLLITLVLEVSCRS